MSGGPTQEWLALGTSEDPSDIPRGKEQTTLRRRVEALLAEVEDATIEGAWIDITHKRPIWVDAAEARRRSGRPDLPGRRIVGQGSLEC